MADVKPNRLQHFRLAELAGFKRCYFVVRSDHDCKAGGDIDLARHLMGDVRENGAQAEMATAYDLADIGPDDCVVLFNIDRPFDAIVALSRIPEDVPCFLYALHHPRAGVMKYLHNATGTRGRLARIAGCRPEKYEMLVDIAKGLRKAEPRRAMMALRHGSTIKTILARCHLLVVSERELTEIEALYGPAKRGASILPHPSQADGEMGGLPFAYALIAGRVEPRKNQLAALRALVRAGVKERGLEIVVVGASGSDQDYFRRTMEECHRTGVIYISRLPQKFFFSLLSSARLIINPSFFEVTSLIDLHAIRNKLPLITTQHAYYDTAPALVQVDPDAWSNDIATIRQAMDDLLALPR